MPHGPVRLSRHTYTQTKRHTQRERQRERERERGIYIHIHIQTRARADAGMSVRVYDLSHTHSPTHVYTHIYILVACKKERHYQKWTKYYFMFQIINIYWLSSFYARETAAVVSATGNNTRLREFARLSDARRRENTRPGSF